MFDTLTRMGSSAAGAYEIERSLRFNDPDDAVLTRTNGTGTSNKKFTFSTWVKLCRGAEAAINYGELLNGHTANNDTEFGAIYFYSGALRFAGWSTNWRVTSRLFRDCSSWYHIVVAVDTTLGTADNRVKMYINGVEETSFSASNNPGQNDTFGISNNSAAMRIGMDNSASSSRTFDGYMAETHFIDGQQLTAASFGETNADTGQWVAKKYGGTYGNNGFYLNFKDNSGTTATTLGKDSSGNGNNFTPNNFSVAAGEGNDSVTDTPTNNFCTWNVGDSKGNPSAISNGALVFKDGNGSVYQAHGTIATPDINAHKYYFEAKVAQGYAVGIAPLELSGAHNETGRTGTYVVYSNGKKYSGTTSTAYTGSWSSATVIGVAIGEGKIKFFKAGNDEGDAFTGLSGPYKPYAWAAGATLTGVEINCGQQPFQHTPPTGYVALCTANLPEPTILKGTDYFDTALYTANGGSQNITSLDFQPNLVWNKDRDAATNHNLTDSVRGVSIKLMSNIQSAEADQSGDDKGTTAFLSNGFTVKDDASGNYQQNGPSGNKFVAWNWKAGGAASSNGDGSATTSVSVNASAGFSIVSFTGTGSAQTLGHGLGVAPEMIIVKNRDTSNKNWRVYHSALGAPDKNLALNLVDSVGTANSVWNNTAPTSTVFSVADDGGSNGNGNDLIAYLWANVDGYCRTGKYTGNGNADGTFIYTGFKPNFVLIKCSSHGEAWNIFDNKRDPDNKVHHLLVPNTDTEENSTTAARELDFTSNGFKIRGTDGTINTNNYTYIYMAFAERPFKYANAR